MKNQKNYIEMQSKVLSSLDILTVRALTGRLSNKELSVYNMLKKIDNYLNQQLTEVF